MLDAGTGLRRLARVLAPKPFRGTIVLGHVHWDHLWGLPFFPSGDRPDAVVRLLLPEQGIEPVELLSRAMAPPLFPITPAELRGDWTFAGYDEGTFEAGGFTLTAREIPHKGGRTMGLRVEDGHRTVAYLSDHAPQELGAGRSGLGELHEAARTLAAEADLLIHDAQYLAGELPSRGHFGHAAAEYGLELAATAGARRLLLFHHDPARTDDEVEALTAELRAAGVAQGVDVSHAFDGLELDL